MNRIVISDRIVELQHSNEFRVCKIGYKGELHITSLLNENVFFMQQGKQSITIINFSSGVSSNLELFSYMGECTITELVLIDKNYNRYKGTIANNAIQSWSKLGFRQDEGYDSTKITWQSLISKYTDMKHNGRNDNIFIKQKITTYNSNTRKYETSVESIFQKANLTRRRTYYRSDIKKLKRFQSAIIDKETTTDKNSGGGY